MSSEAREEIILSHLQQNGAMSIKALAELTFSSEATVRRGLRSLEAAGRVQRFYGGVTLPLSAGTQVPLCVREREQEENKRKVAVLAKNMIHDGCSLFLDGSSTVLALVPHLAAFRDLTVITNGLKTAELLAGLHINTYVTGGHLIENSLVFAGKDAEKCIASYHADLCFISCKGMTETGIFSDTSESETELRKAMLASSETRVMLLTGNKIGRGFLHVLCSAADVDAIISDAELPPVTLRK